MAIVPVDIGKNISEIELPTVYGIRGEIYSMIVCIQRYKHRDNQILLIRLNWPILGFTDLEILTNGTLFFRVRAKMLNTPLKVSIQGNESLR